MENKRIISNKKQLNSWLYFWKSQSKIFIFKAIFVYTILSIGAVIFLIPFFWMITSSLKTTDQIFAYPIEWIPKPFVWQNFLDVWTTLPFFTFLKNTSIITITVIVGRLLVAPLVAYGFARKDFKGKNIMFLILLGTMMIPFQVTIIPLFIIYRHLGWIDTFRPMIVPEFFARDAFSIFLLRQFFLTIPTELDEAAILDGCNSFQVFYKIFLPLSKPALITVTIFAVMRTWNDFFRPLIYINSMSKYPLTLGLTLFQGEYSTEWGLLMAASIYVILPCIILFFCTQKYFVEGIALTGMKS